MTLVIVLVTLLGLSYDTRRRLLRERPLLLDTAFYDKVVTDVRFHTEFTLFGAVPAPNLTGGCGWTRVPKDLLLGRSWNHQTFIEFYTTDVSKAKGKSVVNGIYTHDDGTKKLKSIGNGVYVEMGPYNEEKSLKSINVLFGRMAVDPRVGWTVLDKPIRLELKDENTKGLREKPDGTRDFHIYDTEAYISVKTGDPERLEKPALRFDAEDKFKILQVADAHFVAGYGECRDQFPETLTPDQCLADQITLEFIEKVLEIEKPSLIVLTGDQVFGGDSKDFETAIFKLVDPFIKRGIPYAMVMGNHDSEGDLSRRQIYQLLDTLPLSLSEAGPEDVDGVGNYDLTVQSSRFLYKQDLIMYFLDSHSRAKGRVRGYDYLKESQKELVQKEYTEETEKSAAGITLSMAFFHIPLPEYMDMQGPDGNRRPIVGSYKEGCTAPIFNSHMFTQLQEADVRVLSVGHDHCNDYCIQHDDMSLCYGGGSGEGGYAGYGGTTRRLRIFEADVNERYIRSWKRLQTNPEEIFDDQFLFVSPTTRVDPET